MGNTLKIKHEPGIYTGTIFIEILIFLIFKIVPKR